MEGNGRNETDKIEVSLSNHGTVNKNSVQIRKGNQSVTLYFSYQTIVAVGGVVSVNDWDNTTGKFLNELCPDKEERVPHTQVLAEAQKRLKRVLGGE